MCGIIAVLRCPATRSAPVADAVVAPIRRAADLLGAGDPVDLAEAAGCLEEADSLLGGAPGLESLLGTGGLLDAVAEHLAVVRTQFASVESALEARIGDREAGNAALVRLRDAAWAISNDRLGAARGVSALSSTADPPSRSGQAVLLSVQQALSAWRCGAATPPDSRSPSGTTGSTCPTRPSLRCWPHGRPTRSCAPGVPGCSPGAVWR